MQKKTYKEIPSKFARHRIWLNEVSEHYDILAEDITRRRCLKPNVVVARQTFYWLCWKDRINLYKLSLHLGKHRTTVSATMSRSLHKRDRNAENLIYEKITSQERKREIEKKNNIQESCS